METIVGADGFNPIEQNSLVVQWSSMVQSRLRGAATLFSKGKDGTITRPGGTERKLEDSIVGKTRTDYGVIDRITYSFERHGIFVHKGVGRGYEMQGGFVQRTAKSQSSEVWQPAEWFNPVLDQALPELADRLAEINANAVLNATKMMIK